jgi:hypothetical protein
MPASTSLGSDYAASGTPVPAATNPEPTTAQLKRERVAGNTQVWLWKYLQALTPYIDEIETQFGDDVYRRMLFDPAVKAAIDNLKRAVLAPGAQIVPAVEADHPRYPQAKETADFCRTCLESLQRPTFLGVVWALLDAVAFGNKVAEIVLEPAPEGEYAGKLVLKKLKVRPKRSMAFVVDAYANCVGVLALSPGMGSTFGLMAPLNLVNPTAQPNFIPRDKFLFLTHDPLNEDPRGSSALRAAYDWWWKKQQMGGEWLKHGARFGSPSVVGRLTASAQQRRPDLRRDHGPDGGHQPGRGHGGGAGDGAERRRARHPERRRGHDPGAEGGRPVLHPRADASRPANREGHHRPDALHL